MKKITKYLLLLTIIFTISACSSPLKRNELSQVRSVAIINKAPEHPYYTYIGTTVFNNNRDEIKELPLKQTVNQIIVDRLASKGLQTTILDNKKLLKQGQYDLLIEVIPLDVYQQPGTLGYGVYQRSTFGIKTPIVSYVYIDIAVSSKKNGRSGRRGRMKYRDSSLIRAEESLKGVMPKQWSMVSQREKEILINNLMKQISQSVPKSLSELGF